MVGGRGQASKLLCSSVRCRGDGAEHRACAAALLPTSKLDAAAMKAGPMSHCALGDRSADRRHREAAALGVEGAAARGLRSRTKGSSAATGAVCRAQNRRRGAGANHMTPQVPRRRRGVCARRHIAAADIQARCRRSADLAHGHPRAQRGRRRDRRYRRLSGATAGGATGGRL